MAGPIEHIEVQAFDVDAITFCHTHGHNVRVGLLAHDGDAMSAVAQSTQSSDVVSVQMSVHSLDQSEIELTHELQITVNLFQHRINDQRLAAMTASEEISVGARNAVEELAEDHRRLRSIDHTAGRLSGSDARQFVGAEKPFVSHPAGGRDFAVTSSAAARCGCRASAPSSLADIASWRRRR